jgi:hypothetical protein
MVWTRNKKRGKRAGQRHGMKRSEGVVDIYCSLIREGEGARLRLYGHVIRRDEGEPVKDIME